METALRDHAENDEIGHFWDTWRSKVGVMEISKIFDFLDHGGPGIFLKSFFDLGSAENSSSYVEKHVILPPEVTYDPSADPGNIPPPQKNMIIFMLIGAA